MQKEDTMNNVKETPPPETPPEVIPLDELEVNDCNCTQSSDNPYQS